ncbi:hypothetical protein RKR81_01240, partial [Streptococcus pneumoniae]|nr:hypothetical protein [Streptococcus pneumoniae]
TLKNAWTTSRQVNFFWVANFNLKFGIFYFFVFAGKIPAFFVLIHLIDFAWISSLYLLYHKREIFNKIATFFPILLGYCPSL